MRDLTVRQKALLNSFFESQKETDEMAQMMHDNAPFKGGRYYLGADDLPAEMFAKLEAMNDTEILYQNVERYLSDKSSDYVYKR